MDFGFQLLRHVVQQVFGNLAAAARITILPILLGYLISGLIVYGLTGDVLWGIMQQQADGTLGANPFGSDADAMAFLFRFLFTLALCAPVLLVFYAWAAVGWHRFVLLEESASGIAARWNGVQIKIYVFAVVRLFLMLFLIGICVGFVVGIVLAIVPSQGLTQILTIGMNIGFTWIATRFGLVLPSAALGTYMKLGESWTATAPVSGAIILPIVVIPLGFAVLVSLLGLVPIVGLILVIVAVWLQTLINLALMTTLYGNLIEGRQLN